MAKKHTKNGEEEEEWVYDPVKETVGNKAAEKVIWSSKSLELAVAGIKKGMPLKANPFCGKNTKLLKPNLVYKRTKEEIDDYIKCMQDPIYFATLCNLMTPKGLKPCVLRDYQVDYLKHLKEHKFSTFLSCRQSGKCFTADTKITISIPFNILTLYKQYNVNSESFYKKIMNMVERHPYDITNDSIIITVCAYELFYCFNDSFIWKIRYKLYSQTKLNVKLLNILDFFDFNIIKNRKLTDGYKTTEEIDLTNYNIKIKTDTGFNETNRLIFTKPFDQYIITLQNGYTLNCADKHIVFDVDYNEVYVQDLKIFDKIRTDDGIKKVISIKHINTKVSMCDVCVKDINHRFYSNGILSHNSTTTAIYCLWSILFQTDKSGLILSKSGPAGKDLLLKIKDMFLFLPYHLKCGVMTWNQSSISFDNNSKIETEAFSPTAGLGKTINFLILDEFAWCPPNEVDLFYNNIIPTISADTSANICIMSTQNGFNLFYKLYTAAVKGENIYAPYKVDWWQVPMWDNENSVWVKRDENWKKTMIGVLGSEESFYYQYGTMFSISDSCLVSRETMSRIHITEVLFRNLLDNDSALETKMQEAGIYLTIQNKDKLFFNPTFDFNELKTKRFLILADLAEGGGGDYTVFHIFRIDSKEEFTQIGFWTANKVDLEHAALDYWLICCQLFNDGRTILSVEWNTYGALFYQYLKNYNEPDYDEETVWRMNVKNANEGLDLFNFALYKKDSIESEAVGKHTSNYMPGIRFSGANKHVACSLLRMLLEKDKVKIFDIGTINELENFEDKNGNGSYKAKTGHDDLIMTLCQIPMIQQTLKYKDFMEDFETENAKNTLNSKWSDNENDINMYVQSNQTFDGANMYCVPNQMNDMDSDSLYGAPSFGHNNLFTRIK